MKHTVHLYLLCSFTVFLPFYFCQKPVNSPVIARVGKATLTVAELSESIPTEFQDLITEDQNINYVKQWIETELFYQEALRRKIDNEKEIKKRLNKMKKDLLSSELRNRISLSFSENRIDNSLIQKYYEENKENFIRDQNFVQFVDLLVSDSRIAWYIKKNGTSENILTLAAEYSQYPVPENLNIPFIPIESITPELKTTITSLSPNKLSSPLKTAAGYHVIFLVDKLDKGDICRIEEVREDIINILSNKAQKEKIDNLLSELRLKTNVQFNPALIKKTYKMKPVPQS